MSSLRRLACEMSQRCRFTHGIVVASSPGGRGWLLRFTLTRLVCKLFWAELTRGAVEVNPCVCACAMGSSCSATRHSLAAQWRSQCARSLRLRLRVEPCRFRSSCFSSFGIVVPVFHVVIHVCETRWTLVSGLTSPRFPETVRHSSSSFPLGASVCVAPVAYCSATAMFLSAKHFET